MSELKGMAELMDGFSEKSALEQRLIARQAVELLLQTMAGDEPAGTSHLCLAEDEGQNRDIQIDQRDSQHAPRIGYDESLHRIKNLGRVILLALGVERKRWVQRLRKNCTRHAKQTLQIPGKPNQETAIAVADREQMQTVHRTSATGRLQPYFLIL